MPQTSVSESHTADIGPRDEGGSKMELFREHRFLSPSLEWLYEQRPKQFGAALER